MNSKLICEQMKNIITSEGVRTVGELSMNPGLGTKLLIIEYTEPDHPLSDEENGTKEIMIRNAIRLLDNASVINITKF